MNKTLEQFEIFAKIELWVNRTKEIFSEFNKAIYILDCEIEQCENFLNNLLIYRPQALIPSIEYYENKLAKAQAHKEFLIEFNKQVAA